MSTTPPWREGRGGADPHGGSVLVVVQLVRMLVVRRRWGCGRAAARLVPVDAADDAAFDRRIGPHARQLGIPYAGARLAVRPLALDKAESGIGAERKTFPGLRNAPSGLRSASLGGTLIHEAFTSPSLI